MKRVRIGAVVLAVAGLVALPGSAAAATTCTATLLPTPPGTVAYAVTGTDGHGTFVGTVDGAGGRLGVVWLDGQVKALDNFIPYDINESGLMGGYTVDSDTGRAVAALAPLDGPVRRLTASYITFVNGVNEAGDAVGVVLLDHPVAYISAAWHTPGYEMDPFFAGYGTEPVEIDDTGLAIGRMNYPDSADTVWSSAAGEIIRRYGADTRLYDLDNGVIVATHNRKIVTIDGVTGVETVVQGSANALPFAINDGVVVGSVRRTAMLWRGGEAVLLPSVPNTTTREASVVNATGAQAAGISVTTDGTTVPTLWECSA